MGHLARIQTLLYYKTLGEKQLMLKIKVCLFAALFKCGTFETEDNSSEISKEIFSENPKLLNF